MWKRQFLKIPFFRIPLENLSNLDEKAAHSVKKMIPSILLIVYYKL